MRTLLLICAVALSGCTDSHRETGISETPPNIRITFPTRDSTANDGLVVFQISWLSNSAVNNRSLSVRELLPNGERSSINLVDVWSVQFGDTSVELHEKRDNLLGAGETRLEISLASKSGTPATDTITILRPALQFVRTIQSQRKDPQYHGIDLTICPDGLGYATAGNGLLVFDPRTLELVKDAVLSYLVDELHQIACVAGDPTIYVTEPLQRFDSKSQSWLSGVDNAFGADAVQPSRKNANLLYIGEADGGIGIFDRSVQRRVRSLGIEEPADHDDHIYAMAVLPNDEKIYATRVDEGGILVIDPTTAKIIKRIHVGGNWSYAGRVDDLTLDDGMSRLYAVVLLGEKRGVAVIDTKTDSVVGFLELSSYVPQALSLSPDRKRLFVSTIGLATDWPSENLLIDVSTLSIVGRISNDHPAGSQRNDGGNAFSPDGKYVFVARDLAVDVYLTRE